MKPAEIRKQRALIEREIKALEKQIETLHFQWEQLQDECMHPKMSYYTDMVGDRSSFCPDCGRQT